MFYLPIEAKSDAERTVPVDEWHRRLSLEWKTAFSAEVVFCSEFSLFLVSCLETPGLDAVESKDDFFAPVLRVKNDRKLPVTSLRRLAVGVLAEESNPLRLVWMLVLNSGFAENRNVARKKWCQEKNSESCPKRKTTKNTFCSYINLFCREESAR